MLFLMTFLMTFHKYIFLDTFPYYFPRYTLSNPPTDPFPNYFIHSLPKHAFTSYSTDSFSQEMHQLSAKKEKFIGNVLVNVFCDVLTNNVPQSIFICVLPSYFCMGGVLIDTLPHLVEGGKRAKW